MSEDNVFDGLESVLRKTESSLGRSLTEDERSIAEIAFVAGRSQQCGGEIERMERIAAAARRAQERLERKP